MTERKPDHRGSQSRCTTHIGNVTGQVHTGSGDIIVKSSSTSNDANCRRAFEAVLHEFRLELEAAGQDAALNGVLHRAATQVAAAEREAGKSRPKSERIIQRLQKASGVLVATANLANATTSAATTIGKLTALIQKAIESARNAF